MAKKSSIENNNNRQGAGQEVRRPSRLELKAIASDRNAPIEEQFEARLKLAELPRNSAKIRIRNRCEVTRPSALGLPQDEDVAYRACGNSGPRA